MTNYSAKQIEALIDLYKIAPMSANVGLGIDIVNTSEQLERGILFVNSEAHPVPVFRELLNMADDLYGVDPDTINATFYKTFEFVIGRTRWELFVDQVIHYMGTYGMAATGNKPITLVPMQELKVPDVDLSTIKVTVITLVNDGVIVNAVNETMMTTKSPSPRITGAVKLLLPFFDAPLDDIRSFELAVLAYEYMGVVPINGKAFLRYLLYKTTGSTLIVNNQRTVVAIKAQAAVMGDTAAKMFAKANMVSLATIFLRYKNLFLAFKSHEGCSPYINRLRRMTDTYRYPLSPVTVQNYIQLALRGRSKELAELRETMDNREIIKVLNAMCARIAVEDDGTPSVFNVRNGRSYCKNGAMTPLTYDEYTVLDRAMTELFDHLCRLLRTNVDGKTFYIPIYANYAAPTTEKQFIGNFPWGTSFSGPATLDTPDVATTVGVQWVNPTEEDWVDLDLHCFTADGRHFGWNAGYYGEKGECIYSGDMTNAPAPLGAAEAFYAKNINVPLIFTLNEFRGPRNMKFKLALSTENLNERKGGPYIMDPNKLVFAPIPLQFCNNTGMCLGFLYEGDFYLYGGNLSEGAVPRGNFQEYIKAIVFQQQNKVLMRNLLAACGGRIIDDEDAKNVALENGTEVIDLSPEALTASTLLDIVDGKVI